MQLNSRNRAELDTSAYDTGVHLSNRQMEALALTHHDWRGDWNYNPAATGIRPGRRAPGPSRQPSPDLAWLCTRS